MKFTKIAELGFDETKDKEILLKIEQFILSEVENRTKEIKEECELEKLKFKRQNTVENEIILAGAKNVKATLALIDIEEFDPNNLNSEEIRKKIDELKFNENTSFLFNNQNEDFKLKGIRPLESNLKKRKAFKNMGYEELCKYYDQFNNL